MQEVFSFSPSLPLFFSPIAHSVRKSVSVSKPFEKNTERTASFPPVSIKSDLFFFFFSGGKVEMKRALIPNRSESLALLIDTHVTKRK